MSNTITKLVLLSQKKKTEKKLQKRKRSRKQSVYVIIVENHNAKCINFYLNNEKDQISLLH